MAILLVASVPAITGCGNFFIPVCQAYDTCTTTTGTTTTTSTSAASAPPVSVHAADTQAANSYVYVSNAAASSVTGYSVSSGTAAPIASPVTTPLSAPSAVAATPHGNQLYVATESGSIYLYRIARAGSMQIADHGTAVAQVSHPIRMTTDNSGTWLFVASSSSPNLQEFHINAANGSLQPAPGTTLSAAGAAQIYLAPDNLSLFVALGKAGIDAFPFNPKNGVAGARTHLSALTATSNDSSLASDSNSRYLYAGEIGTGIRAFQIVTDGELKEMGPSPLTQQENPTSLAVDPTNQHLLVTTSNSNQIAAFSIGDGGVLTPAAHTVVTQVPSKIFTDSNAGFLVSAPLASSATLQLFRFDPQIAGGLQTSQMAGATSHLVQ